MPPFNAEPELQRAALPPNGAGTKARTRQKAGREVSVSDPCGITPAMNRAIERLSAGNSLLAGADVLRMALHPYLLSNDPHYRHEL